MKKTIILGAFASLMMVSCAKDYTCKCTTSIPGLADSVTSYTVNAKKKDATAACEAYNTTSYIKCVIE